MRGSPAPGAKVDVIGVGVGVEERFNIEELEGWRGGAATGAVCGSRGVYSGTLSLVGSVEW